MAKLSGGAVANVGTGFFQGLQQWKQWEQTAKDRKHQNLLENLQIKTQEARLKHLQEQSKQGEMRQEALGEMLQLLGEPATHPGPPQMQTMPIPVPMGMNLPIPFLTPTQTTGPPRAADIEKRMPQLMALAMKAGQDPTPLLNWMKTARADRAAATAARKDMLTALNQQRDDQRAAALGGAVDPEAPEHLQEVARLIQRGKEAKITGDEAAAEKTKAELRRLLATEDLERRKRLAELRKIEAGIVRTQREGKAALMRASKTATAKPDPTQRLGAAMRAVTRHDPKLRGLIMQLPSAGDRLQVSEEAARRIAAQHSKASIKQYIERMLEAAGARKYPLLGLISSGMTPPAGGSSLEERAANAPTD